MPGHADSLTRRRFVGGITLAGASGLLGLRSDRAAAEPPPEVTAIRISHSPSLCTAPQFIAEELLRAEGFADVQYVKPPDYGLGQWRDLATGKVDVGTAFSGPLLMRLDAQDPLVLLFHLLDCREDARASIGNSGGSVRCFLDNLRRIPMKQRPVFLGNATEALATRLREGGTMTQDLYEQQR